MCVMKLAQHNILVAIDKRTEHNKFIHKFTQPKWKNFKNKIDAIPITSTNIDNESRNQS